jgi:hypothetical protein
MDTTLDGRTLILRQAEPDDASDFIRIVDCVAREELYFLRSRFEVEEERERSLIAEARDGGDLILLALVDERPVGWVTLFRSKREFTRHTAELGIGVIAGYREIGIGTALMGAALMWAAEHGIEKVNLGVRANNERAQRLYRSFHFVQEGYRVRDIKDRQGRYHDCIEMACFLDQNPYRIPRGDSGEG